MHLKEIDTKKGVYNYYIDFLVRAKKKEIKSKNILIEE